MRILWLSVPLLAACHGEAPDAARRRGALGPGDAAAADLHPTCTKVGYAGCCGPAQTLVYCVGGAPLSKSCAPAFCGWDPVASLYACGSSASLDPSGAVPRACPGADAGPPADGARDGVAADLAGSCGPLGYAGCCAGSSKLLHCVAGSVLQLECGPAGSCGWSSTGARYECGSSTASDPSGLHPRPCSVLFGDGGPRLDGGPDLTVKDQAVLDQPRPHDGPLAETRPGERPPSDTVAPREVSVPDLRARELATGLDPTGLDRAGDRPGSIGLISGGGGCACSLDASLDGRNPLPLLAVLIIGLLSRRRGQN
jgi:hypothetical protein